MAVSGRSMATLAGLGIASLLAAAGANAQVAYEGCYVGNGIPVPSVANYQVQDIAVATRDQFGNAVIFYNPQVTNSVTPQTRVFFYFHECAHHALGHTLGFGGGGIPINREQEADCWAIRNLVSSRRFSRYDVQTVQNEIARFGRGDWSHLPGPQRAMNLVACL